MSDRSIPQLALEVVDAGIDLVKAELDVARAKASKSMAKAAVGGAFLAFAAIIGLIGLIFLVIALFHALDSTMAPGLAALVTALIVFVVAGILAAVGIGRLRRTDDA
jgi:protein-S-isoprenylcysteine O-methyltransferase Ste14